MGSLDDLRLFDDKTEMQVSTEDISELCVALLNEKERILGLPEDEVVEYGDLADQIRNQIVKLDTLKHEAADGLVTITRGKLAIARAMARRPLPKTKTITTFPKKNGSD